MTPAQAISVLDQATARAQLTRDEHATVARALQTIQAALLAAEQAKAPAPSEP